MKLDMKKLLREELAELNYTIDKLIDAKKTRSKRFRALMGQHKAILKELGYGS